MKCKLRVLDPTGVEISVIEHNIPIAVDLENIFNENHNPLVNLLEIGSYRYWVLPDGKIELLNGDKTYETIDEERKKNIELIWAEELKEMDSK